MKRIIRLFVVVQLCCMLYGSGCFGEITIDSQSIVGWWGAQSARQPGSILEFRDNGMVYNYSVVMIDYLYSVNKGVVTLKSKDSGDKPYQKQYVLKIMENRCHLIGKDGDSLMLTREKGDYTQGEPSIVGKWSFKSKSGSIGYYVFKSDGNVFLRVPMPGSTISKYSLNGNNLEIIREDIDISKFKYMIDTKGVLTLTSGTNGKEWKYKRVNDFQLQLGSGLDK